MSTIVSESQFREALQSVIDPLRGIVKSVSGPKRSGAIASVYASYRLGVPWLPHHAEVPERLRPCLIVDTAARTGASLRKAARHAADTEYCVAIFTEPPRLHFWYEELAALNALETE